MIVRDAVRDVDLLRAIGRVVANSNAVDDHLAWGIYGFTSDPLDVAAGRKITARLTSGPMLARFDEDFRRRLIPTIEGEGSSVEWASLPTKWTALHARLVQLVEDRNLVVHSAWTASLPDGSTVGLRIERTGTQVSFTADPAAINAVADRLAVAAADLAVLVQSARGYCDYWRGRGKLK